MTRSNLTPIPTLRAGDSFRKSNKPNEMCMKPLISLLITSLIPLVAAWAAQIPTTAAPDPAKAAQDNNAFAIELYGQLRKQSGTPLCSPESISTALAITYLAARIDTAA